MGIKIPLFFEYDISTVTPSSIAEFTASDVVPVKNGGTGASSMIDFFADAAAWDLSAKSVSSMTGVFVDLSATMVSATLVSALTVSANNIFTSDGVSCVGDAGKVLGLSRIDGATYPNLLRASEGTLTLQAEDDVHLKSNSGEDFARFNENAAVWLYYNNAKVFETQPAGVIINTSLSSTTTSSTDMLVENGVSANTVSAAGGFVPGPYGYVHFTTAGTANDVEQNIGIGCSKTENISSADDFSWDDTNKRFNVSAAGTYEFTVNAVLMVDATTTITLQLYNTYPGASKLTADTRVHSSIDADIVTLTYVGAFTAGSYAYATTTDDGSTDVTIYPGTSMLIKRLK